MNNRDVDRIAYEATSRLQARIFFSAFLLDVIVLAGLWKEPPVARGVFVVCVVAALTNGVYGRLTRAGNWTTTIRIRQTFNAVAHLTKVFLAHADPILWIWVAYFAIMFNPLDRAYRRGLFVAVATAHASMAFCFGRDLRVSAVALGAAASAHLLSDAASTALLRVMRDQARHERALDAAHHQLRTIHERALGQDKLSSLGLLAAGIAHEINNPMSFVTANLKLLEEDLGHLGDAPALRAEYQNDILPATIDGVQRVNAIVADLRRFARGDLDVPIDYDVNDELRGAVRMTAGRFRAGSAVELELGELPIITGYPRQISQVTVNLLLNAAQAIGRGGTVRVSSGIDADGVWLRVADTGVGMDASVQARIFEPFFTTKQPGEGTGLGLAVVHGIVTGQGGRIDVESHPGQGTTFTVHVPQRARRATLDSMPRASIATPIDGS